MINLANGGMYSRLQEKFNTRQEQIKQMELKNFSPRTQSVAKQIYKGGACPDCDCQM